MAKSSVVLMSLRNMSMPSFVLDEKTGLEETGMVHRIRRVKERKTTAGGPARNELMGLSTWLATASSWVCSLVNVRTSKSRENAGTGSFKLVKTFWGHCGAGWPKRRTIVVRDASGGSHPIPRETPLAEVFFHRER